MKKLSVLFLALLTGLVLVACSTEAESKEFTLSEVDGSGVSGTITFEKVSDTETKITIDLDGTPAGGDHPAHIHEGDIDPGGGIYISLTNVNGDTGMSVTTVTETDGGDAVTYEDLLDYDGYVNIHLSADNLATIVANGEVGAGQ